MFIKRVVKSLDHFGVRYALVGGYAVALHGAVRGTVDVDLVIKIDEVNVQKAYEALTAIGLASRIPVTPKEIVQFRKEYIERRNLTAWSFTNSNNPSEMVDIIITHDLSEIRTCKMQLGDFTVTVIDLSSLIAMKRSSARKQDFEDIKALESL